LPFVQIPADRPIAFLELFAAGKPVVTTHTTGVEELVRAGRGWATRPCSNALASAWHQANTLSAAEYCDRSSACLEYMRQYPSWEQTTDRWAELLMRA
jgi:glycosyltransferase involved in cell wall biosynthesis